MRMGPNGSRDRGCGGVPRRLASRDSTGRATRETAAFAANVGPGVETPADRQRDRQLDVPGVRLQAVDPLARTSSVGQDASGRPASDKRRSLTPQG